jgi:hypothetical protein
MKRGRRIIGGRTIECSTRKGENIKGGKKRDKK